MSKAKTKELFFTVVNTTNGNQHRINADVEIADNAITGAPIAVQIKSLFAKTEITIDPQQMAELGHLLIALSGHKYDQDAVDKMLDGYEVGLVGVNKKFVDMVYKEIQKGTKI